MTTLENIIDNIDGQLLKTEMSAKDLVRPQHLEKQEEQVKYVLVHVGSLRLALPIGALYEIGPLPPVTPLPNLPSWFEGIINLRSEIISVIDLQAFLQVPAAKPASGDRLVILNHKEIKIGLRTDQIRATVSRPISDKREVQMSSWQQNTPEVFRLGLDVDDEVFHIFDPQRFMTLARLIQYNTAQ